MEEHHQHLLSLVDLLNDDGYGCSRWNLLNDLFIETNLVERSNAEQSTGLDPRCSIGDFIFWQKKEILFFHFKDQ